MYEIKQFIFFKEALEQSWENPSKYEILYSSWLS